MTGLFKVERGEAGEREGERCGFVARLVCFRKRKKRQRSSLLCVFLSFSLIRVFVKRNSFERSRESPYLHRHARERERRERKQKDFLARLVRCRSLSSYLARASKTRNSNPLSLARAGSKTSRVQTPSDLSLYMMRGGLARGSAAAAARPLSSSPSSLMVVSSCRRRSSVASAAASAAAVSPRSVARIASSTARISVLPSHDVASVRRCASGRGLRMPRAEAASSDGKEDFRFLARERVRWICPIGFAEERDDAVAKPSRRPRLFGAFASSFARSLLFWMSFESKDPPEIENEPKKGTRCERDRGAEKTKARGALTIFFPLFSFSSNAAARRLTEEEEKLTPSLSFFLSLSLSDLSSLPLPLSLSQPPP